MLVLTTMGSIAISFLLLVLWTVWHDDSERREVAKEKALDLTEVKMLKSNARIGMYSSCGLMV